MPNVLIRDLPADVHANLQRRAEAAGQSLQQYLTKELSRIAESPTITEVIARIAERSGGRVGFQTAVDDLALAEALDCPLLTADARLAAAPTIPCVTEVLRA